MNTECRNEFSAEKIECLLGRARCLLGEVELRDNVKRNSAGRGQLGRNFVGNGYAKCFFKPDYQLGLCLDP